MARNGLAHTKPYLWNERYMMHNSEFIHRKVFEENFGEIPEGMLVHHIDEDRLNNSPSNLELISRADHCKLHLPRLGYRALIPDICDVCGQPRTEKEKAGNPHRWTCNKCRGKAYREKKKVEHLS